MAAPHVTILVLKDGPSVSKLIEFLQLQALNQGGDTRLSRPKPRGAQMKVPCAMVCRHNPTTEPRARLNKPVIVALALKGFCKRKT